MAKLSSLISTHDSTFRDAVTRLLRSCGTSIGIVEERDDGAAVPDVAFVDARTDTSALKAIERLRARWTTLAIYTVAGAAEPEAILQAMRAGANEFFTWSTGDEAPPRAMVDGVRAAIQRTAERLDASSGGSAHGSTTLSFFGAKGGAGTTTLAVNCAIELARLAKRPTVVVDLNPFLGEVGLFLGVRPRFTLLDALDNLHRLESDFLRELVAKHKTGLDILAGSDQIDRPGTADAAAVEELLQILGRTYGCVVVDGGTLTNACAEVAVFAADAVLLVANPDVPSIRNTQRLVDRIEQMGAAKDRIRLLLNRHSGEHVIAPQQIEQAVGHPVDHAFPSDYGTVSAALNAGVPLTLSNHSELATQFGVFTRRLAGVDPSADTGDGRRRGHFLGLF